MAANYLHGAEVIEVKRGARTIRVVKSSVIALTGIAPTGPQNVPTLVVSETDAAQFGSPVTGFNIPQALEQIFDQGAAVVIVVNVFDAATDTVQVTGEAHAVASRKVKLTYAPVPTTTVAIFQADGTTPAGLVLNTDYTVDAYGNIAFIAATAPDTTALKFNYKRLDPALIANSQIIGTTAGDGTKTGLQCLDLVYSLFGFSPKIIIVPGYAHIDAIAAEMRIKADKFRAISLIDAPAGISVSTAISGRGPLGTVAVFNTSHGRSYLLYPGLKAYDTATDGNQLRPMSSFIAGLISQVDANEGYWYSPSNHEIAGVTGVERPISAALDDATCEANLLNEAGIATFFNGFGTGMRFWGNRSAAWPSDTSPLNFVCVRRTADIISESIILSTLQFIDKPIDIPQIDAIRESVNDFIKTLIARGALIDGKCTFNYDDNTTSIPNGHLNFNVDILPPSPGERISYMLFVDASLGKALAQA